MDFDRPGQICLHSERRTSMLSNADRLRLKGAAFYKYQFTIRERPPKKKSRRLTMANNLAAYLPAEHGKIEIGPVESHTPSANEILIENLALGINPFEMKLQQYAFMPLNYPAILGIAFAGVVTNVGSGVEDFVEGDRVVVYQFGRF